MKALLGAALGLAVVLVPSVAAAEHLRGTSGPETLVGTPARDRIEARGGADEVRGLGGNDVLAGAAGDDWVRGGRGNDEIEGNRGRDLVIGGPGRDSLDGGRGIDELVGGPGDDYLADHYGGDTMDARAGDDRATVASRGRTPYPPTHLDLGPGDDQVLLEPDGRRDVVDCGPGHDVVEFLGALDPQDQLRSCETVRAYQGKRPPATMTP